MNDVNMSFQATALITEKIVFPHCNYSRCDILNCENYRAFKQREKTDAFSLKCRKIVTYIF